MAILSHRTGSRANWTTPQPFFDRLNAVFRFRLDASADDSNHKCPAYFSPEDDALQQDLHPYGVVWCNPTYGRNLDRWLKKAYEESRKGCIVVCLIHARTDTRWWHAWVKGKAVVTFVKGRLKFGNAAHAAPFPSVVVVYGLDLDAILNDAVGGLAAHGLPPGAAGSGERPPGCNR